MSTEPVESEVVTPSEVAEPEHPGVVVLRIVDPVTGEQKLHIADIGGHDPLATPSLLRLAANVREKQLGV